MSLTNLFYQSLVRPHLFAASMEDPEIAHDIVLQYLGGLNRQHALCRGGSWWNLVSNPALKQDFCGITFPNPVGIGPGVDKNADLLWPLAMSGAGHIEIGGVLPRQQTGNDRPRTVRLPGEGLLNRMGFNSKGAPYVKAILQHCQNFPLVIGINLGKMKDTPNEEAHQDYCAVLRELYEYASYFVLNISSPNTPGLRQLQSAAGLKSFLEPIQKCIKELANGRKPKPLGVKLAPEMPKPQLYDIVDVLSACWIDFVALGNTILVQHEGKTYGKSGPELLATTEENIRYVYKHTEGKLPIIGCGGVNSADSACRLLEAGANLVQVVTGMYYKGPLLPKEIVKGINRLFRERGIGNLTHP